MESMLAYIDPGSGSLIIQMLIATAVAIPLFFRHQVGRVLGRFRRPATPDPMTAPAAAPAALADAPVAAAVSESEPDA